MRHSIRLWCRTPKLRRGPHRTSPCLARMPDHRCGALVWTPELPTPSSGEAWCIRICSRLYYGPLCSNCPMRDERPEYAKRIFGSVSFTIQDRQVAWHSALDSRRGPPVSYGQPTPGAGASAAVSTWPVRDPSTMFAGPRHSVAIRNSVLLSAPPSMHAKQPRSRWIACSTS
jgi:hypothetical protein